MKSEELTDDGIFTACSYERNFTSTNSYGWNRGNAYETGGVRTDCVIEKFVAKLGQVNWTLPLLPTKVNNVASWYFIRQNATSS